MDIDDEKARRIRAYMIPDPLSHQPEWLQVPAVAQLFGLSRATAHRLVSDMRTQPAHSGDFLNLSQRLKLINVAGFTQYLHERSARYLRA